MSYTLPSNQRFYSFEKLKSSQHIARVFRQSTSFRAYPLVAFVSIHQEECFPVQAAFVVSKKKCRRAVDRNWVKRRLRESYRMQKAMFYQELKSNSQSIRIVFMYTSSEKLPFQKIDFAMQKLLGNIKDFLSE